MTPSEVNLPVIDLPETPKSSRDDADAVAMPLCQTMVYEAAGDRKLAVFRYIRPRASLAALIWANTSSRYKRYLAWNVPLPEKGQALAAMIARACELFIFSHDEQGILGWAMIEAMTAQDRRIAGLDPDVSAGVAHFCSCRRTQVRLPGLAAIFLSRNGFDELYGYIPRSFHAARNFVQSCGFLPLFMLDNHDVRPEWRSGDTKGIIYRWQRPPAMEPCGVLVENI